MTHDDGTTMSLNNGFTLHTYEKRDSIAIAFQKGANNSTNTSRKLEERRASGHNVKAVYGLKSNDVLAQKQVIAYSRA